MTLVCPSSIRSYRLISPLLLTLLLTIADASLLRFESYVLAWVWANHPQHQSSFLECTRQDSPLRPSEPQSADMSCYALPNIAESALSIDRSLDLTAQLLKLGKMVWRKLPGQVREPSPTLEMPLERVRENVAAQLRDFDGYKARPISGA